MANKNQIEQAKEIFLSNEEIERLYMNPQGEFFTDINYARNSVEDEKKIQTLTRKGVLKAETEVETANTKDDEQS
ncbi:MAG: hypothetical protein ACTTJM_03115 [Bergeyella cardium]